MFSSDEINNYSDLSWLFLLYLIKKLNIISNDHFRVLKLLISLLRNIINKIKKCLIHNSSSHE